MTNENQMSLCYDEISLTDLFLTVWRRRGLVIALPILVAMNHRIAYELHQALGGPITTVSLLPSRVSLILVLSIALRWFRYGGAGVAVARATKGCFLRSSLQLRRYVQSLNKNNLRGLTC